MSSIEFITLISLLLAFISTVAGVIQAWLAWKQSREKQLPSTPTPSPFPSIQEFISRLLGQRRHASSGQQRPLYEKRASVKQTKIKPISTHNFVSPQPYKRRNKKLLISRKSYAKLPSFETWKRTQPLLIFKYKDKRELVFTELGKPPITIEEAYIRSLNSTFTGWMIEDQKINAFVKVFILNVLCSFLISSISMQKTSKGEGILMLFQIFFLIIFTIGIAKSFFTTLSLSEEDYQLSQHHLLFSLYERASANIYTLVGISVFGMTLGWILGDFIHLIEIRTS
ncbi:MAG: hypothetical protein NW224_00795 [Leptolyngbyaceae cyanobacterium bins.302]|nr:hypothetical protein [Leptolyngbyaceae cyanobacterium bins.302]